jgi:alkanesulfonate monooxygenase SsuD/methylene tetrahydromethanopterin reductase-like flavin-dependent oxidoreductase (luciferase family)
MKRIPMERPEVPREQTRLEVFRSIPSEKEDVMSFGSPQARELAARESDGIHVLLLWHPDEDAVTVSVEDARVGDRFHIAVAPDRALDAFYHPFAYAA